jgi:hypothetical protein
VPPLQAALDVQAMGLHVLDVHAPPLQSLSAPQVHPPFLQTRPVPHWLSFVHAVWLQVPPVAPLHVNPAFGQSALVPHGSEQVPVTPCVELRH